MHQATYSIDVSETFIRLDKAQAAVLTVEPLSGNIILASGSKAP